MTCIRRVKKIIKKGCVRFESKVLLSVVYRGRFAERNLTKLWSYRLLNYIYIYSHSNVLVCHICFSRLDERGRVFHQIFLELIGKFFAFCDNVS